MGGLLDGKIALVTGVSNDGQIGQSVARVFAHNGAGVGIAARSQKNVEARAKELEAGTKVLALQVDLTDETQVGQAVERVIAHYGRIHILVNLAGGLTRYKAAVDSPFRTGTPNSTTIFLPHSFALARCFPTCGKVAAGASSTSRAPGALKPTWWPTIVPKPQS